MHTHNSRTSIFTLMENALFWLTRVMLILATSFGDIMWLTDTYWHANWSISHTSKRRDWLISNLYQYVTPWYYVIGQWAIVSVSNLNQLNEGYFHSWFLSSDIIKLNLPCFQRRYIVYKNAVTNDKRGRYGSLIRAIQEIT